MVFSVRLVTVRKPVCIISYDVWPVNEVRGLPISFCLKDQGPLTFLTLNWSFVPLLSQVSLHTLLLILYSFFQSLFTLLSLCYFSLINSSVCNSFSDKWSPALQIRTVLLSIQALLSAPNPDDPLANDVAEKWKSSEAEAIETGERVDLARGFILTFHPVLMCSFSPPSFRLKEHLA